MSPPRLLALDLDGTLLRSDNSVSRRTRGALARARESGAVVVLVTARSPRSARKIAADLGLDGWAICSNGAAIYDLDADRMAEHRPLDTPIAHSLVRALRELVEDVVFGWESEMRFGSEPAYEVLRSPEWPRPEDAFAPSDPLDFPGPFTKVIARCAVTRLEHLHATAVRAAQSEAEVTLAGDAFVEMLDREATKGIALERLAMHLGVSAAEAVAFGDQLVDISMLEWAGHGVAPSNARPEVRAAAGEVTSSNDDDGVALVLERLFA